MKRIVLTTITIAILAGAVSHADNPAIWNFDLETIETPPGSRVGNRDDWYSTPSFIDPGYSSYEYIWEITRSDVEVLGQWYPSTYPLPSGSGTTGALPFSDMLVHHIDEPEIVADIFVSVDFSGYGNIYIDNVIFGQAQGFDVTGTRFWGNVTITPEPATLLLFGLGGLMLRRKKRS